MYSLLSLLTNNKKILTKKYNKKSEIQKKGQKIVKKVNFKKI